MPCSQRPSSPTTATKFIVLSAKKRIAIKVNEEGVGARAAQAVIKEVSEALNYATAAPEWLTGREPALENAEPAAEAPAEATAAIDKKKRRERSEKTKANLERVEEERAKQAEAAKQRKAKRNQL